MRSLLPFIIRQVAGTSINLLIDSGAAKNYIKPIDGLNLIPVNKKFNVKSIHGASNIDYKCNLFIFGVETEFFVLDSLTTFDGIIGLDVLSRVGGIIDLKSNKLITDYGEEDLKFHDCANVNYSKVDDLNVPECVKGEFERVIENNKSVFADPEESLPYNTNVVATIRTVDNVPIYSRPYPYPVAMTDFVNNEIENLVANGIIRPSRSPYNNPIWVVDKKGVDDKGNRNKRLVIDFRKLNDKTVDDKYPIPDITKILSNLRKAKYFTTLDLKSGFHQISLAESDREKTAFSVNNGKYEFCRLGFGLKNAPSIFQRAIDDVLREFIGKFLQVYIDDVLIYSESEEDHVRHIRLVLEKLITANMRVSLDKCKFFQTSVEYLGFVVSRDGISTCPSKVEAILKFEEPSNLFMVRSFLGLAGYYRRFIKDFAKIQNP